MKNYKLFVNDKYSKHTRQLDLKIRALSVEDAVKRGEQLYGKVIGSAWYITAEQVVA